MKLKEYLPKSGIYKITCTATGKSYIGQSKEIEVRMTQHIKDLESGQHNSVCMLKDYKIHGMDCFDVEILEEVGVSELRDRERFWVLSLHKKGIGLYNLENDNPMRLLCGLPGKTRSDIYEERIAFQSEWSNGGIR
jgi:group I intron endonuclease